MKKNLAGFCQRCAKKQSKTHSYNAHDNRNKPPVKKAVFIFVSMNFMPHFYSRAFIFVIKRKSAFWANLILKSDCCCAVGANQAVGKLFRYSFPFYRIKSLHKLALKHLFCFGL